MRRCPRCTFTLVPHAERTLQGGSVTVDVCPRCSGAWLSDGDAKKLFGENADPATWARTNAAHFIGPRRMPCPDGHGRLSAFALDVPHGERVEVDVCPACMGMWLDAWEGKKLADATRDVDKAGAVPASAQKTGLGWYLFQLFTALPVEEYNPVRRRPVVCLALIAACIAAYFVEILQPSPERFIELYGLVPTDIEQGRHLWSLVTHMFLHGGLLHIAFNMWFLYTFGDNVEDRVGRWRFLLLYFAFGLFAAATQVVFSLGSSEPLVGASGAIAGLMGAYCVLFPRARVYQVLFFIRFRIPVPIYLLVWVGLQFVSGFLSAERHAGAGVAWWAHVGGFAIGALWATFNRDKYGDGAEVSLSRRRAGSAAAS